MQKSELVLMLRSELSAARNMREQSASNADLHRAKTAVKSFQVTRMAATHADLLAASTTHAAARFFLDDLYGADDLSQRDADIEKIVPMMERLLPAQALETISEAFALDALSERLDTDMAMRLGADFSTQEYVEAFRTATKRSARERQVWHVESVGSSLCRLVRTPLIGTTLKMMGGPAKIAGLADLHGFLERGFKAFKSMTMPERFVELIISREMAILENIYAGRAEPFDLQFDPR